MIARYETNDLHLAATLQWLGLELLEVDRSDPRRVRFVFEDGNLLIRAVPTFILGAPLLWLYARAKRSVIARKAA